MLLIMCMHCSVLWSLSSHQFKLFCVHPVSGERLNRRLEVHQDELMPVAMKRAYEVNSQLLYCMTLHSLSTALLCQVMELSPHVPIERCRLVKYDDYTETLDESFDPVEVS